MQLAAKHARRVWPQAAHRDSAHQWVGWLPIPAVEGEDEQQERLPKPLAKSNAATLLA